MRLYGQKPDKNQASSTQWVGNVDRLRLVWGERRHPASITGSSADSPARPRRRCDADLDARFDSGDLVAVLASGEYDDDVIDNSGWASGDWSGDGDFASADLVVVLADGGYEQGPRMAANAVPEPESLLMLLLGLIGVSCRRRKSGVLHRQAASDIKVFGSGQQATMSENCAFIPADTGLNSTGKPSMRTHVLALVAILPIACSVPCQGGSSYTDDFDDGRHDDGSPVTWVPYGWHLGKEESSCRQRGSRRDAGHKRSYFDSRDPQFLGIERRRADELYHDVDILAQVRALADGPTTVGLGALDTLPDDQGNGRGVYLELILFGAGSSSILLNTWDGGSISDLNQYTYLDEKPIGSISYLDSDLNLRLVVSGNEVLGSAWPAGTPEPSTPLLRGILPPEFNSVQGHVVLVTGGSTAEVPIAFRQITITSDPPTPLTVPVAPSSAYVVRDNVIAGDADGHGDRAVNVLANLQQIASAGELDATTNGIERIITKFELPERTDARQLLENATLRVFLERIQGTPGPLSLLHSLTDNDLDRLNSDFEDASYTETLLNLVQPTDAVGRYFELNVTDLVRADYWTMVRTQSAFRFQIDEVSFLEDNQNHRYVITSAGNGRPELVLSFTGEPGPIVAGDLDLDGVLTVRDIDALAAAIRRRDSATLYDVSGDGQVLLDDHRVWVHDLKRTWFGDANLDGEFNSADLVAVLAAGEYEDGIESNSGWAEGDFNGDGEFNSSDLITALADGGYEQGPRPAQPFLNRPTR